LTTEGFQSIWDIPPKTSAHLIDAEMKRRCRSELDAEAWRDNALCRTTSVPRLVNADHLASLEQRWAAIKRLAQKPWEVPPEPVKPPQKIRVVHEHRVATSDEAIGELQRAEILGCAIGQHEALSLCSNTNKVRHKSKLFALYHRNQLAVLPDELYPEQLEAYKCRWCGSWHVGHKV
jgi:hypothetical protein